MDYGLFYSKESNLSLTGFSDSDQAGNADNRKSTTGGCFYVGANLVAWMSKKQNFVSLSTAKAKYIATGSCCSQLLWMKQFLTDYGISQDTMVVYCNNSSAINIYNILRLSTLRLGITSLGILLKKRLCVLSIFLLSVRMPTFSANLLIEVSLKPSVK